MTIKITAYSFEVLKRNGFVKCELPCQGHYRMVREIGDTAYIFEENDRGTYEFKAKIHIDKIKTLRSWKPSVENLFG